MEIEEVLKSHATLDDLIVQLAHAKITNVSGSAYRCHPQMYWERGVLITSHWHVSRRCDINVATVPSTKIIPGIDDSQSQRSPYPTVEEGELIKVWDGKWLKDGPWVPVIHEVIAGLILRLESYRATEIAKREQEESDREEADRVRNEKLLAGWIGATCKT